MRLLCAFVLLLGCMSERAYADSCEAAISDTKNHIVFIGCISDENSRTLIEKMLLSPSKPLIIVSEGGGVDSAIRVARALVASPRKVVFLGDCNSSCANYILPAAKPAVITEFTSFVLHGDAAITLETRVDEVNRLPIAARRGIERLAESEKELWRKLPGAEVVHQFQRVAMESIGLRVSMRLGQRTYQCTGLGATRWRLDLAALDEILAVWTFEKASTFGDIKTRAKSMPELPSVNPLERCSLNR